MRQGKKTSLKLLKNTNAHSASTGKCAWEIDFYSFEVFKLVMAFGSRPVKKKLMRAKRQKAVAEGRQKQAIEFSREMTFLRIEMKNLSKKRKTKVINFLLEKGVHLGKCNLLLENYRKFINKYSAQATEEVPFELISAKEERAALRQMKLLASAVKRARKQKLL